MTKKLILLVGLPRAGKSTHARRLHEDHGLPIVQPDAIRLALHGQRYLEAAEPLVWALALYMVRSLFLAGHEAVIVDATHGTRKHRNFWRSKDWRRVYHVLDTPKEVCSERARAVGDAEILPVIERMAAAWEPVGAEEWQDA